MSVRPRGTDRAEVIRVIRTTSLIGEGIEKDPVRYIYQYWDFDGNLLASKDEYKDSCEENTISEDRRKAIL